MVLLTIDDCHTMQLALRFIRHKARTTIIEVSTGLSKNIIRRLYRSMHNEKPASGQLPQSIQKTMDNPQGRLQAMVFFSIYKSMYKEKVFERMYPEELVNAYEHYLESLNSPRIQPLSINQCWVLARDLRASMILISSCDDCNSDYVNHTFLNKGICPACEIKKSLYCNSCGTKLHRIHGCLSCVEEEYCDGEPSAITLTASDSASQIKLHVSE